MHSIRLLFRSKKDSFAPNNVVKSYSMIIPKFSVSPKIEFPCMFSGWELLCFHPRCPCFKRTFQALKLASFLRARPDIVCWLDLSGFNNSSLILFLFPLKCPSSRRSFSLITYHISRGSALFQAWIFPAVRCARRRWLFTPNALEIPCLTTKIVPRMASSSEQNSQIGARNKNHCTMCVLAMFCLLLSLVSLRYFWRDLRNSIRKREKQLRWICDGVKMKMPCTRSDLIDATYQRNWNEGTRQDNCDAWLRKRTFNMVFIRKQG